MEDQVKEPAAPKTDAVNVFNPDNELVSIPKSQLAEATSQLGGYRLPEQGEVEHHFKEEKYGSLGQQAITALEGFGVGATGGASTAFEKHVLRVPEEDIQGRQEINPGEHDFTNAVGFGASEFVPVLGETNLLKRGASLAGKGLEAAGVTAKGASLASRIAMAGGKEAISMGLMQGGDEISKMIANDPKQGVDSAVMNIGLMSLIGGATGGALSGVGEMWKAKVTPKFESLIEQYHTRAAERLANPDLLSAKVDALQNVLSDVEKPSALKFGGAKKEAILKNLPEMSEKITQASSEVADKLESHIEKLEKNGHNASQFKTALEDYRADVNPEIDPITLKPKNEITASEHFDAADKLKRRLQDIGYDWRGPKDIVNAAKSAAYDVRNALEDSSVWGKAAEIQSKANKSFSELLTPLERFTSRFTSLDSQGARVIDPGKLETYLKQLGGNKAAIKKDIMGGFLEAAENHREVMKGIHSEIGSGLEISSAPKAVLESLTGEGLSPGAKLYDYLAEKGANNLAGEGLGTATGAGIGSLLGHGGIGALIGERALAPFFKHILPSITGPLLENGMNSQALKSTLNYGMAILRGQTVVNKLATAIFRGSAADFSNVRTDTSKREKLEKRLEEFKADPHQMIGIGSETGQYLPNHGAEMAKTALNAVNTITALKPAVVKKNPLDTPSKVSDVQKAQYNRALDIAQQPLIVMKDIKDGTITSNDVNLLNTLYPGAYKSMAENIHKEMIAHLSKEEPIPYKTRLGLSTFLAQPLDSTMTSGSIISAQPKPEAQPQQQGNEGQHQKHSMTALNKMPGMYQTPEQARASARSK